MGSDGVIATISALDYLCLLYTSLEYKDEKFDEYQRLTELKQRAYVYTDNKSYDITEPVSYTHLDVYKSQWLRYPLHG